MSDSVLVIGGGIAGIQASLDLAESGARVVLVERAPSIGGKMAVLDKNFPTLDCSICIEAPKMSEVGQHPGIEVLSLAAVESVAGEAGRFRVGIRQRARFVTDECTRCGECVPACPVVLPNEFDAAMASRKAIYTPIPQAVPGPYVVDIQSCLNDPPNYLPCQRCVQACGPKCIDFAMPQARRVEREVGSIVVAVGYDLMDPFLLREYGYGSHPDILTSIELERLLTSAGPTGGEIIRPSDGRHPERVLLVLCVGSRDRRFYRYCSRFCCMYSVKHAFQLLDHGVKDVTVLYMDLRAYGKGFDGFLERTRAEGAKFVRGRPSSVRPENGHLRVRYEDTDARRLSEEPFDMVVLATAVRPPDGLEGLARVLGIEVDQDGFIQAVERRAGLIATTRPGIYAAGCAGGPKDIPDSVAEAGAAASLALGHLSHRTFHEEPRVEPLAGIETPRVGVFVCHCGSNIAGVVDVLRVVEFARTLPDVVWAQNQMFSCAGNTQREIEEAIRSKGINRVVVAACSPKTHEGIFRKVLIRAGLNPFLLEMVNVRNQDSWVHKAEKEAATQKAIDMVWMGVEKARRLTPLEMTQSPVIQAALVVGGGIAGMTAATALARQGYETHLVEKEAKLGGLLRYLDVLAPSGLKAQELLEHQEQELREAGVRLHLGTEVEQIGGFVGNFAARLSSGEDLRVGAVVLATGARPYAPTEFLYNLDSRVITNLELEGLLPNVEARRVTFVGCVGSRENGLGCSRYCCASMIGQALALRRMGKQVRVLFKDIRTFSRHAEELYETAMREGVQFFRCTPDQPPEEAIAFDGTGVTVRDHLLGGPVRIPTDLLVLVVGLRPQEEILSQQLKIGKSQDGFLLELHPKLGPAETASQGIYLAGACQAPKDVRESVAQALAAAAKAGALLAKDVIEKEPLTARLDPEICNGCMLCVPVCPYGAIEQLGKVKEGKARVIEAACMGCGNCAATCNHDAIAMPYFTKDQILAQLDAALAEHPEEKVLVFTCNWCSYAGADQAGIEKIQYPSSARIIRTMCSARFEGDFIDRAFERGVGAVLVTGCRLTENGSDCHYNYANKYTAKRFGIWQKKWTRRGIAPERFQLQWISASEGKEFAAKVREMHETVQDYLASRAEVEPDE
ncbi:MAG: FAD-dependent oxidoreductase [Candidatus Rokubacteria bacterium]|nr:FAD-dependent oxidoreductase [Candidatus Rokubacteria bacterium]